MTVFSAGTDHHFKCCTSRELPATGKCVEGYMHSLRLAIWAYVTLPIALTKIESAMEQGCLTQQEHAGFGLVRPSG